MGDQVTIEKSPASSEDPILIVSYVPNPPSLTIRHIAKVIQSSNDPPYNVTIHRPPTLGDLTKAVRTREKRDMLIRLGFTTAAAIPTFILAIVFMSLIKDGNPGKMFLMEPIWAGNVSRLVWALLFISTPVMFYSANIFHRKCIKDIRALWRKSNSATLLHRLTRFGSMNLLASSGITVAYISSLALLVLSALSTRSNKPDNTTYFDVVVFLTMFLLIGKHIQTMATTASYHAKVVTSSQAASQGQRMRLLHYRHFSLPRH
jgi:Cu+-exporting ATPase